MGILEQAVKNRHSAPGRGSHRLHVNSGQQLRSQISLDKSPWLCYAQLSFQFCATPVPPASVRVLLFLALYSWPSIRPPWALAGDLNSRKERT